ncbi:MAG: acyltransferase family protein [Schleiferiaceae bacterium]
MHLLPHDGRPDHQPELDGFRGLAVLLVLLAHSSNAGYPLFGVLDFHHYGSVGVYLFFVLSAYLIDRQILTALSAEPPPPASGPALPCAAFCASTPSTSWRLR